MTLLLMLLIVTSIYAIIRQEWVDRKYYKYWKTIPYHEAISYEQVWETAMRYFWIWNFDKLLKKARG